MNNPILSNWLNNIYSLEIESIRMLESHKGDAVTHPEITRRIEEYSKLCTSHAVLARQALEKKGKHVSTFKSTFANIIGKIKGMSTELTVDKVARNARDEYSHSYSKKAAYTLLLAGAKEVADNEIIRFCEDALKDEKEYTQWLDIYLPQLAIEVTLHYNQGLVQKQRSISSRIRNFTPLHLHRQFNGRLSYQI